MVFDVHFRPFFYLLLTLIITLLSFPTPCFSQSDADALIKFKESFIGGDLVNWIPEPGTSPCLKKWVGVLCRGEAIVGLHLTELHLSGTVDVQPLLQLPSLRSISLMRNFFTGPIPEFNKLGALKSIYLSNNQFSGEIPNDYFRSMLSLKKVWFNGNNFTGNIPESVMQLPNLLELHLEGNQFSGTIPPLKSPHVLASLNLTLNKLQGKIPESLSNFSAASFQGNQGLCGLPLTLDCVNVPHLSAPPSPAPSPSDQNKNPANKHKALTDSHGKGMLGATTIFIALCFIISSIISKRRRKKKDEDFSIRNNESVKDAVLPVYAPRESIHKNSISKSSRRSKSGSAGKNGLADLVMVNCEKGKFGFQDLMKAAAEVLGNGVLGSAYKAVMENGLAVVVKRMKEMNRLEKAEFDVAMRRIGTLDHPNIMKPLAYHFRRGEKLLISEYMPTRSLLYALHDARDPALNWSTRLKIIKGIVQGLSFIHTEFSTHDVPHGNLKSSNVLLTESYDPLLSDYAFQPLTNASNVADVLFAYKSPEYLQYQQVSPKSDIYCLGIVILEILTGKFPSQYLSNAKGGVDIVQWVQMSILENQAKELIDPELTTGGGSVNQMLKVLKIGAVCAESNPDQRLQINEVITRIEEVS